MRWVAAFPKPVAKPYGYLTVKTLPNEQVIIEQPPSPLMVAPAPVTMSTGEAIPQYSSYGTWNEYYSDWGNYVSLGEPDVTPVHTPQWPVRSIDTVVVPPETTEPAYGSLQQQG